MAVLLVSDKASNNFYGPQILRFFKTQSKLNRLPAGWMETLGNFKLNLTYRLGHELLQANALSHIYTLQSKSDSALDPDWSHVAPVNKI